jgi:Cof subfamily protein (haloacid dehalogenase superfamily)
MRNIQRIICFDLDGTLLAKGERIRSGDLEALSKNDGTLFIPASGRSIASVKEIFHKHGLFTGCPIHFPLVLQNGAISYLPDEKIFQVKTFDPDVQQKLIDIVEQFSHIPFFMVTDTYHFVLHPNAFSEESSQRYKFHEGVFNRHDPTLRMTKIMALNTDPDQLLPFYNAVTPLPVERFFSQANIVEVTPQGVNKGNSLLELLHKLQIPETIEILVAGDAENDLPLFSVADRSFTLPHAEEKVRKAADFVIEPKEEGLFCEMLLPR